MEEEYRVYGLHSALYPIPSDPPGAIVQEPHVHLRLEKWLGFCPNRSEEMDQLLLCPMALLLVCSYHDGAPRQT